MVLNILPKITTGYISWQWLEFVLSGRQKSGKFFCQPHGKPAQWLQYYNQFTSPGAWHYSSWREIHTINLDDLWMQSWLLYHFIDDTWLPYVLHNTVNCPWNWLDIIQYCKEHISERSDSSIRPLDSQNTRHSLLFGATYKISVTSIWRQLSMLWQ